MAIEHGKLLPILKKEFYQSWALILIVLIGGGMFLGRALADPGAVHSGGVYQGPVYQDPCTFLQAFAKDYTYGETDEATRIRLIERGTGDAYSGRIIAESLAPNPDPLLIAIGFPTVNHGTVMPVPAAYRDGAIHYFDIYVMDLDTGSWIGPFDPHVYDSTVNAFGYYFYDNFTCGVPPVVYNYDAFLTTTTPGPFNQGTSTTVPITYFATNIAGNGKGPAYALGLEKVSGPNPPASGVMQVYGGFAGLNPGQSTPIVGGQVPPQTQPVFNLFFNGLNPPGTYCFESTVTPSSTGVTEHSAGQICIIINAVSQPYIQTSGSDVQAGGDCSVAPNPLNGLIKVNSGLLGDTIVSSGGLITPVATGAIPIPTYGQVCRPDLITLAQNATKTSVASLGGVTTSGTVYALTVGTLPAGNVLSRSTLYVNGNLRISGNITTGSSGELGIIVNGDVYIDPTVTQINAYIFAKNTIYTCGNTVAPVVAACSTTLNLSGLMSGGGFVFGRTGGTVGGAASENFTFRPAVYLLTPPLFEGLVPGGRLNTFTEKPPLY